MDFGNLTNLVGCVNTQRRRLGAHISLKVICRRVFRNFLKCYMCCMSGPSLLRQSTDCLLILVPNKYFYLGYIIYNTSLASRYLVRALLIPFAYDAPTVTIDALDHLLHDAPVALPQTLQISKALVDTERS